MPRYVLVIGDRSVAVFDAPNFHRANALKHSADLSATLKHTYCGGIALWNGSDQLNFRLPEPLDEARWQKQRRANNAEFGLDEDQGLFVWLTPVDNANRWFHMKDHWKLW